MDLPVSVSKQNLVKVCRVKLHFSETPNISSVQLRGFCGHLFVDDAEFHHHSERSYHYPLVQYKKVDGVLMIVGFQEYASVLLNKLASLDSVLSVNGSFDVNSKEFEVQTFRVQEMDCFYEFVSSWLPLNGSNYNAFQCMNREEQKSFLERILVGNTLSCLKGLGLHVDFRVTAKLAMFRPLCVKAHGNKFEAFRARFCLNVSLPDFTGLGKSVSKGFGTIRRLK